MKALEGLQNEISSTAEVTPGASVTTWLPRAAYLSLCCAQFTENNLSLPPLSCTEGFLYSPLVGARRTPPLRSS